MRRYIMSLFLWRFCIRSVNSAVVFHGPSATEHAGPELKYSIATAAKCLFNVPVLIYLCISFCKTLTLYSHGHYWSKIVFFFFSFSSRNLQIQTIHYFPEPDCQDNFLAFHLLFLTFLSCSGQIWPVYKWKNS